MKSKWLLTIPIICSLIFITLLGMGGYLLYQTGIKRDEYQWDTPPFAASTGIWVAVILVLVMLVVSLSVICIIRRFSKRQIVVYGILAASVMLYSAFSYVSNYQFYDTSSRMKTVPQTVLYQTRELQDVELVYFSHYDRYYHVI